MAAVAGELATGAPGSLAAPPSVHRMNLEVLAAAHGAMVGSREKEEDVGRSLSTRIASAALDIASVKVLWLVLSQSSRNSCRVLL